MLPGAASIFTMADYLKRAEAQPEPKLAFEPKTEEAAARDGLRDAGALDGADAATGRGARLRAARARASRSRPRRRPTTRSRRARLAPSRSRRRKRCTRRTPLPRPSRKTATSPRLIADEPPAVLPEPAPQIQPPAQASRPSQEDLAALDALLHPASAGPRTTTERSRGQEKFEPQFRPPTTPPRKAPARPAAAATRSRIPMLAAGLAGVVLATVAAWYFLLRSPEPAATPRPAPPTTVAAAVPTTTLPPPTLAASPAPAPLPAASATPAAADSAAGSRRRPPPTPVADADTEARRLRLRRRAATPRHAAAAASGDARALLRQGAFAEAAQSFAASLAPGARGRFSHQLLTACAPDTIAKAVQAVTADELFILPVTFQGRSCYRLCWGVYDTPRGRGGRARQRARATSGRARRPASPRSTSCCPERAAPGRSGGRAPGCGPSGRSRLDRAHERARDRGGPRVARGPGSPLPAQRHHLLGAARSRRAGRGERRRAAASWTPTCARAGSTSPPGRRRRRCATRGSRSSAQPQSVAALQALAAAQIALGDTTRARATVTEALALEPGEPALARAAGRRARRGRRLRRGARAVPGWPRKRRRSRACTRSSKRSARSPGSVSSARFRIRFDGDSDEPLGLAVLNVLDQAWEDHERRLGFAPDLPVTVVLQTAKAFQDTTRAPGWAAAWNDGTIRVPVMGLDRPTATLVRVLRHEVAHSFVASRTGANCPTWLQEGLAQWLEGGDPDREDATLASLARGAPLPRLDSLEQRLRGPPGSAGAGGLRREPLGRGLHPEAPRRGRAAPPDRGARHRPEGARRRCRPRSASRMPISSGVGERLRGKRRSDTNNGNGRTDNGRRLASSGGHPPPAPRSKCSRSGPVSRILFPPLARRAAIIPLAPRLPAGSSNQPGGFGRADLRRPPIRSCSAWGFPCPAVSPRRRCALTAPFHPCHPRSCPREFGGVAFCGTFPGVAPAGR